MFRALKEFLELFMPARSGFLGGGTPNSGGGGGSPTPLEARVALLETTPTLPVRVTTLESGKAPIAAVDALGNDIDALVLRVTALEGVAPTSDTPNRSDGKPIFQLGPAGEAYFNFEDTRINHLSKGDMGVIRVSGRPDPVSPVSEWVAQGVINPETLLPTTLVGPSVTFFDAILGLEHYAADWYPDDFAGRWFVTWDGQATLSLPGMVGQGITVNQVNANRLEILRNPGQRGNGLLFVNSITPGSGFGNVKVFREADEAMLNVGHGCRSRLVNDYKRYKVLRFMDWLDANTTGLRTVDQLKTVNCAYRGNMPRKLSRHTNYKCWGYPTAELFDLVNACDSAMWYNVSPWVGADVGLCDIFDANEAYTANRYLAYQNYGQANAAAIIASNEWRRYADHLVANMQAKNYPLGRMFVLELSNEPWNTVFDEITGYYRGVANAVVGLGEAAVDGNAYMAANLAKHFQDALNAAGRSTQRWRIAINTQHDGPSLTTRAWTAFRKYFTDRGMDAAPWAAKGAISTALYVAGIYDRGYGLQQTADPAQWLVNFKARIQANPTLLRQQARDFHLNGPNNRSGAPAQLLAYIDLHIAAGAALGVTDYFIYEEECHDLPYGQQWAGGDPVLTDWHNQWCISSELAAVMSQFMASVATNHPNVWQSNFVGRGPGTQWHPSATRLFNMPWHDDYHGQDGPKAAAISPLLRPAT
jgi:hypothetical protein